MLLMLRCWNTSTQSFQFLAWFLRHISTEGHRFTEGNAASASERWYFLHFFSSYISTDVAVLGAILRGDTYCSGEHYRSASPTTWPRISRRKLMNGWRLLGEGYGQCEMKGGTMNAGNITAKGYKLSDRTGCTRSNREKVHTVALYAIKHGKAKRIWRF